jgi:hypothetical protein
VTKYQRDILAATIGAEDITVRGVEYPSHPQIDGGSNACMKLTTMVVVNEVSRTWVDWYDEDGQRVYGRELVDLYNVPTFSERRDGVDPMGPETAFGGLIGQQPY